MLSCPEGYLVTAIVQGIPVRSSKIEACKNISWFQPWIQNVTKRRPNGRIGKVLESGEPHFHATTATIWNAITVLQWFCHLMVKTEIDRHCILNTWFQVSTQLSSHSLAQPLSKSHPWDVNTRHVLRLRSHFQSDSAPKQAKAESPPMQGVFQP